MSEFFSPYDADRPLMLKCSCGRDHTVADHHTEVSADAAAATLRQRSETREFELYSNEFIEATLVKALFPQDAVRRRFLRAVGKGAAMSAIASVLPVASLQAMAQEKGALEKKDLKIGFIPITCATPLIMAHPLGFYRQQGLNVDVVKTAGWALIRDKMLNKEYDATHFLSPMPLAISLGLGSNATPMNVATIQNTNGQAITLSKKLAEKGAVDGAGLAKLMAAEKREYTFAQTFPTGTHAMWLYYWLASYGINPMKDAKVITVPPPQMVANMKVGKMDGFCVGEPWNAKTIAEEIGYTSIATQ
eukprot:gene18056-25318_t